MEVHVHGLACLAASSPVSPTLPASLWKARHRGVVEREISGRRIERRDGKHVREPARIHPRMHDWGLTRRVLPSLHSSPRRRALVERHAEWNPKPSRLGHVRVEPGTATAAILAAPVAAPRL